MKPDILPLGSTINGWQELLDRWADNTFDHDQFGIALHGLREQVELCLAIGLKTSEILESVHISLVKAENKDHNVGTELADCAILLLALAGYMEVDLEAMIREKHAINLHRTWSKKDSQGVVEHKQ